MRYRRTAFILIALIVVTGTAGAYFWGLPRVVQVDPPDGAESVPANQALRITFSRPMEAESITRRLVVEPAVLGSFTWEGDTLVFAPTQPWPSGEAVQVRLAPGGLAAGLMPLTIQQEMSWTFTIGHPLLLYLSPPDGPANLYRIDPQSEEITQLTQGLGSVEDFSTNAAGTLVYFSASLGNGGSSIYRLELESGESNPLLDCPDALCRYAQISPDGLSLAYERTPTASASLANTPQVWMLPISAETEEPAGEPILAGPEGHRTQQPGWSPGGLLVYYDYTLAAFNVQDAQGRQITRFLSQTGVPGDWDPAGEHYVIPEIETNELANPELTGLETVPFSRLLEYSLAGGVRDLTGSDDVEDASPAYAPDGQRLAFARKFLDIERWTPGRQLWLMKTDGSEALPLTKDPPYNHYDLAWRPDGRQLAYVRFNKDSLLEPPEIWLVEANGTNARRLVSGGYLPQWIP